MKKTYTIYTTLMVMLITLGFSNVLSAQTFNNRNNLFTIGLGVGGTFAKQETMDKQPNDGIVSINFGYMFHSDSHLLVELGFASDLDSRIADGNFALSGFLGVGYNVTFNNNSMPIEFVIQGGGINFSNTYNMSGSLRLGYMPHVFPVMFYLDLGGEYLFTAKDFGFKLAGGIKFLI